MAAELSSLTPAQLEALLNGPALPPPHNVIPNFDHPDNQNIIPGVVVPICLVLASIAFLLRSYARIFCVKKIELPDVLMVLAFGCYLADIYLGYRLKAKPGAFVHQWDVRVKDMPDILFPMWLSNIFYIIAVLTIKAAILLEWVRIFVPYGVRNRFFWLCHAVLGMNTIFYIVVLFVMIFPCIPVEKAWNPMYAGGYCTINTQAVNIASAVLNLASDIFILILPQRIIWGLKMSAKTKRGVSVIFAIGIVCCIAATIRLASEIHFTKSTDELYNTTSIMLCALAEMTCMFLVFGVPSVAKIISDSHLPSRFVSSLRSLKGRFPHRSSSRDSGTGAQSWPGSSIIMEKSQANTSHSYYHNLESGNGPVFQTTTTIDSTAQPISSESMERLRENTGSVESGKILRTTQVVTHEDYGGGGYEREGASMDGYDRQHPWARDRI